MIASSAGGQRHAQDLPPPRGSAGSARSPLLRGVQQGPDPRRQGATERPAAPRATPGRVTMHRLNRFEYNNTVRDLLGTAQRPADDFPADDHSYGFDDIADVLTISPTQLELYERAADALATEAMAVPTTAQTTHRSRPRPEQRHRRRHRGLLEPLVERRALGSRRCSRRGRVRDLHARLRRAGRPRSGEDLDRRRAQSLGTYDVDRHLEPPGRDRASRPSSEAGKPGVIGVEFLNDFYDPDEQPRSQPVHRLDQDRRPARRARARTRSAIASSPAIRQDEGELPARDPRAPSRAAPSAGR
jgi:hypothetical protein